MAFLSVKLQLTVQKAAVDNRRLIKASCCITGIIKTEGVLIVTIFRKLTIFLILSGLSVLMGSTAAKADVEKFSDVPV